MFDHYIAIDWAQENMAIARMTGVSDQIHVIDVPSDIKELKVYLKNLKGTKILTFEETTTAQWLYVELKDLVDEVIACDPHRNRLLSDGPKTDKIDARKLVMLLRAGLLKAVFHSWDELFFIRKLVSGYEDLVQAGVRMQNQRAAILRAHGKDDRSGEIKDPRVNFVLRQIDRQIELYQDQKLEYEAEFEKQKRRHAVIRMLDSVPGIGVINAVKLAAIVVDARRFPDAGNFLAYSGLIKHDKISGGRSYGKRSPRFNRRMKAIFKTAATSKMAHPNSDCPARQNFDYLVREKKYSEHDARHAMSRLIAKWAFGVMKSGKPFDAQFVRRNWTTKTQH